MNEKVPLSVAIITKSEAENLPACHKSVEWESGRRVIFWEHR